MKIFLKKEKSNAINCIRFLSIYYLKSNHVFKFAFDVPKRVSNIVNASSVKSKRIYV